MQPSGRPSDPKTSPGEGEKEKGGCRGGSFSFSETRRGKMRGIQERTINTPALPVREASIERDGAKSHHRSARRKSRTISPMEATSWSWRWWALVSLVVWACACVRIASAQVMLVDFTYLYVGSADPGSGIQRFTLDEPSEDTTHVCTLSPSFSLFLLTSFPPSCCEHVSLYVPIPPIPLLLPLSVCVCA